MRGVTAFVAIGVILTAPAILPASPTAAARCVGTSPAVGRQVPDEPWAQQRYQLARLSGIADGSGITVGVVDSGVDAGTAQLHGALLSGADELEPPGNGQLDCVGHGTAVASIIAAAPVAGVRFAGVAPGASILPVRATERESVDGQTSGRPGTVTGLASGIAFAVDHGATVLNLSLVLADDDPVLRHAIAYAQAHDVLVIAAAGNGHQSTGTDPVTYPAGYPGVLGVGAIDRAGNRTGSSPVGSYVDIVAPGAEVLADAPGSGLASLDGTSFATAFVSGTAALIRQAYPDLTASSVASRILATADPAPAGPSSGYGAGILNPYRAVTEQPTTTTGTGNRAPVHVAATTAHPQPDTPARRLALYGVLATLLLTAGTALVRRWRVVSSAGGG
jgi:type VII secretion-associated serine protease mycosin